MRPRRVLRSSSVRASVATVLAILGVAVVPASTPTNAEAATLAVTGALWTEDLHTDAILSVSPSSAVQTQHTGGDPILQSFTRDGALDWSLPADAGQTDIPAVVGDVQGGTYVQRSVNDDLHPYRIQAIDPDGSIRWSVPAGITRFLYGVVGYNNSVYFVEREAVEGTALDRYLIRGYDRTTGAATLEYEVAEIDALYAHQNGLIAVTWRGEVSYLGYDGSLTAHVAVPNLFTISPFFASAQGAGGAIFVTGWHPGEPDTISVVKLDRTGVRWTWREEPADVQSWDFSLAATPDGGVIVGRTGYENGQHYYYSIGPTGTLRYTHHMPVYSAAGILGPIVDENGMVVLVSCAASS